MATRPLVFLDFETDGLKTNTCVPTQLALVFYDQEERKEVAKHEFFICPPKGHELNREILAKTDVSYEDAMSGVTQREACNLVHSFVKESVGGKMTKFNKPTIVAHNAPFDVSFMMTMFINNSADIAKTFETQNDVVGYICTQRLFTNYVSNPSISFEGSKNLGSMCDYFDVPLFNAHGAMADTLATKSCWEKMTSGSTYEKEEVAATQNLKKKRNHFQI